MYLFFTNKNIYLFLIINNNIFILSLKKNKYIYIIYYKVIK